MEKLLLRHIFPHDFSDPGNGWHFPDYYQWMKLQTLGFVIVNPLYNGGGMRDNIYRVSLTQQGKNYLVLHS